MSDDKLQVEPAARGYFDRIHEIEWFPNTPYNNRSIIISIEIMVIQQTKFHCTIEQVPDLKYRLHQTPIPLSTICSKNFGWQLASHLWKCYQRRVDQFRQALPQLELRHRRCLRDPAEQPVKWLYISFTFRPTTNNSQNITQCVRDCL